MAAQNEPATGMDFWAAIGVGQEEDDGPEEQPSQDKLLVTGTPAPAAPADMGGAAPADMGAAAPADMGAPADTVVGPAADSETGQPSPQDDWASLFSAWDDSANGAAPAPAPAPATPAGEAGGAQPQAAATEPKAQKKPRKQDPEEPADATAEQPPEATENAQGTEAPSAPKAEGAEQASPPAQDHRTTRSTPFGTAGQATQTAPPAQAPQSAPAPQEAPAAQTPREPSESASPQSPPPPAADQAWAVAESIATTLRPRVAELWLEVLTRHTGGDPAMASRVYHVLNGTHLLGELMRDETIDEVHVHGTQVTVCGARGIRQIPGFPSLSASRRAVKTITASREKRGLVVSKVNDSVVISRRNGAVPNTNGLVASGVVSGDQLARIRQALQQMQAVTVTGPAARIVIRALASLIPEGSRVFLGAYATLPAGCVTAVSPMEADYVLGVRPGAVAEEMAGAGQVGGLIANPETQFPAALRFAVTGPSAAPERLVDR